MKVKKYEELNESLNLGDKWSRDKFEKLQDTKDKLDEEISEMKNYLKRFLLLKTHFDDGIVFDEYCEIEEFDYHFQIISVTFIDKSNFDDLGYIELSQDEFDDLLDFIENPDTYKNTKKYNL